MKKSPDHVSGILKKKLEKIWMTGGFSSKTLFFIKSQFSVVFSKKTRFFVFFLKKGKKTVFTRVFEKNEIFFRKTVVFTGIFELKPKSRMVS